MGWQKGWWASGTVAAMLVLGMGLAAAKSEAQEAWLGVYTQTLTSELREGLNYSGSGALVSRVISGGPAERAGVRKGDVIVGVNSSSVTSSPDLSRAIRDARVGQAVSVRVVRDGQRRILTARLAERPSDDSEGNEIPTPESPMAPDAPEPPATPDAPEAPHASNHGDFDFSFDESGPGFRMFSGRGRLGVRVEDLNSDLGSYFGIDDGRGALVVEVLKDTPAERAGLKAGDVITRVADGTVADTDQLVRALRAADRRARITVVRHNATKTMEVELNDSPRTMRLRGTAPFALRDGGERVRRLEAQDDVRRELEELRRELRDLKSKLEERGQN